MIEITVWLLIAVSNFGEGQGVAVELGKFSSAKNCQQVQVNLPGRGYGLSARCIQATILVPK